MHSRLTLFFNYVSWYTYVSHNSLIAVINKMQTIGPIIHNKRGSLYNTVAFNNNVITFTDLRNHTATSDENKQGQHAVFVFDCEWDYL